MPTMQETLRGMFAAAPAPLARTQVEQVVATYIASHQRPDFDLRATLFAEDIIAEEPVGAPPMVGKAALRAFWEGSHAAGWRAALTLEQIVVGGNEALVIFTARLSTAEAGAANLRVFENLVFDAAGRIVRLRAFNDAGCIA